MRRWWAIGLLACGGDASDVGAVDPARGVCEPGLVGGLPSWEDYEAAALADAEQQRACRVQVGWCAQDGGRLRYARLSDAQGQYTSWFDEAGRGIGLVVQEAAACTEALVAGQAGPLPTCVDPEEVWLGCEGRPLCGAEPVYVPEATAGGVCGDQLALSVDQEGFTPNEAFLLLEEEMLNLRFLDIDADGSDELLVAVPALAVGVDLERDELVWNYWSEDGLVEVADVDGDGVHDLVWATRSGVYWLAGPLAQRGPEDPADPLPRFEFEPSTMNVVTRVGDIDGQPGDELVVGSMVDGGFDLTLFSPSAPAEAQVVATLRAAEGVVGPTRVTLARDYTGDGVLDLLVAPYPWERADAAETVLYRGPLVGEVQGEVVLRGAQRVRPLGDVDLDGHDDLAAQVADGWYVIAGPFGGEVRELNPQMLGQRWASTPTPVRAPGVEALVWPVEVERSRQCWTTGEERPPLRLVDRGALWVPLPLPSEVTLPDGVRLVEVANQEHSVQIPTRAGAPLAVLLVDGRRAARATLCVPP